MIKNGTHCQYDVRVTIHDSLACGWIDYSSKFSSVFFTVFFICDFKEHFALSKWADF